ncbi:TolC family protein [Epilithonimonas sp.]|uniref:TolC family protein n=1 Tax=Epilithonimonas sp. TaxID=2894511 RepID=UPI002FDF04B2
MISRKNWFVATLLFFTFSLKLAGQKLSINLNELLILVESHSKEIALEELKTKIAESEIKLAKSNQLPSIIVSASVDKASNMPVYDNGIFNKPSQHDVIHTLYNSGASFYLNIFDGFKTKNEIKLADILLETTVLNRQKLISAIKLKAVYFFIDLHLQKQWKATMMEDIQEKEHELSEIKNLYKAGTILESDVLRAGLELSKRKMTLKEIDNTIIVLQQQLNVLMGNDDTTIIDPEVSYEDNLLPPITLENSIHIALNENFDEKISDHHMEVSQKKLELSKGDYYPKIGLTASFQFANPQIFLYPYNASWYNLGLVGIKATYDISGIYHNKHKVEEAKIKLEESNLHHQFVSDEVRTKIYKAYYQYDEALDNEKILEQNEKYADENVRILKNAYFNQTALITDLLDANLLQIKARFELEQAKMNILKTYYSLQFETSTL